MTRLTDDEVLELVEQHHLGETQEAIIAELDTTEWTYLWKLADALYFDNDAKLRSKLKRMLRHGYVEMRKEGGEHPQGRWMVRLPQEWPARREAE